MAGEGDSLLHRGDRPERGECPHENTHCASLTAPRHAQSAAKACRG